MPDREIRSLDVVGERLGDAFERVERRTRRRRTSGLAAVGVAALVVATLLAVDQISGDRILTVDQAVAEVQQGSFELPRPSADQMLYTNQETMWTSGGGTTTRTGKRLWTNVYTTVRQEQWTNPKRNGMSRSSHISSSYVSPQDEAIAKSMEAENERERRRMERARKMRGDRRPVPRYPVMSPPFTELDKNGNATSKPLVCPLGPARGWIAFDGDPLTPAEVRKLPTDSKALYERAVRAARGFRKNVDRDRWVWSTIHWALSYGVSELSSKQRSAMVGAIAYVTGVRTLGETKDPLGRKTIGFVRDGRGQRDELYFDASTSLPIYARSINTTKRNRGRAETWPVGSVFQKSVIHETRIVDRIPSTVKPKRLTRGPKGHYLCLPSL